MDGGGHEKMYSYPGDLNLICIDLEDDLGGVVSAPRIYIDLDTERQACQSRTALRSWM